MKTYGGWRYGSNILDLNTRTYDASGQLHTPAALPQGNSPRYSLDKTLGGHQTRYGRYGEVKNLAPSGNRTWPIQPVARRFTDWAIPAIQAEYKIVLSPSFVPCCLCGNFVAIICDIMHTSPRYCSLPNCSIPLQPPPACSNQPKTLISIADCFLARLSTLEWAACPDDWRGLQVHRPTLYWEAWDVDGYVEGVDPWKFFPSPLRYVWCLQVWSPYGATLLNS
jgi:hypothetical protein